MWRCPGHRVQLRNGCQVSRRVMSEGKMSSGERSRRRRLSERAQRGAANTPCDEHTDEALRVLVRILAREAARELFERSCVSPKNENTAEDAQP